MASLGLPRHDILNNFFPFTLYIFTANKPINQTNQLNQEEVTNGLWEHAGTASFWRARAEINNLLCELASNAKIWGAREQASTRLNFVSKSSKGRILRAVKNFNGPFITPLREKELMHSLLMTGFKTSDC